MHLSQRGEGETGYHAYHLAQAEAEDAYQERQQEFAQGASLDQMIETGIQERDENGKEEGRRDEEAHLSRIFTTAQ